MVIITYRRPLFLKKCLNSIAFQTRKPDEVVIVFREDDIETQNLINYFITSYKNSLLIKGVFVTKPGMTIARNRGIKNVSGDIICFIDDDSVAVPEWVERIEPYFCREEIGAVGGPCPRPERGNLLTNMVDEVLQVNRFGMVSSFGAEYIVPRPIEVYHLQGTNMSFRRELLNSFDENLVGHCYREDMDVCLSIKKKGYKIIYDPEIVVYHYRDTSPSTELGRYEEYNKILQAEINNTYVLLKHLSPRNRLVFLLFTILVGDIPNPGILRNLIRAVRNRRIIDVTEFLLPALKGKLHGVLLYLRCRSDCSK